MQRKGAGAVLATLWPVADESTALLMNDFYRLWKPGTTKLQALRQAQLRIIRGGVGAGPGSERRAVSAVPAGGSSAPPWPKGRPRFAPPLLLGAVRPHRRPALTHEFPIYNG